MRYEVHKQGVLCLVACLVFSAVSSAQNVPIPVTIEPQAGFNNGPVLPVGLSVPARMMNGPRIPSVEKQIRINIRYVLLDPETRKQIYQRLGAERLTTVGGQVPNLQTDHAGAESADTRGTEIIAKSSRVTTSILSAEDLKRILQDVASSAGSQITRAPSIVLIDGQETDVTDLVQRPFVVDLQRQTIGKQPAVNSVVQVLNEGISIHLSASLTPSQRIHVVSEIIFEKVLDVETEEVFGISEDATTVQVPVHQRKTVNATENLQIGETLLVDAYVKHESQKMQTTGVPVLSSLPYISKSFTNTEAIRVQQQMIILIQPTIEAEPVPLLPH